MLNQKYQNTLDRTVKLHITQNVEIKILEYTRWNIKITHYARYDVESKILG